MEWLEAANGIIALISALVALIGTGTGVFFAIKNWIKLVKTNSKEQNKKLIMSIADAAMKTAEQSGKSGAEKKQMVIDIVKASCAEAGIDADEFIDQIVDYIDQTIQFVNDMKSKTAKK